LADFLYLKERMEEVRPESGISGVC